VIGLGMEVYGSKEKPGFYLRGGLSALGFSLESLLFMV
jgi:hypothetical protein